MTDGSIVQIATEQNEIRVDDCVFIEQSSGRANIRRSAAIACQPESAQVMAEPEIQEELQEEAGECSAAKEGLLAAESDAEIDLAVRKIKLLCYG